MSWEVAIFLCGSVLISVGCLMPASWLPPLPNDKLLHFLAFGGLALLAGRIAQSNGEWLFWLGGIFLGGWLIEVVQNWMPGRKFCWRDLGANTLGILAAVLCTELIARI